MTNLIFTDNKTNPMEKTTLGQADGQKGFSLKDQWSDLKGWPKHPMAVNSKGGTEQMMDTLYDRLPEDIRDMFQVVASRVDESMFDGRPRVLWLHDLWNDPQAEHLKSEQSRERFRKLVFVSHTQQHSFCQGLGIPYQEGLVLKNAIDPIEEHAKPTDRINLIYHTTPHRGLDILVAAYEALSAEWGDKVHLNVYSSFKVYGWPQRDEEYKTLFDKIDAHPHMTNHGAVPNADIRQALKESHIFAYPSTWVETSCIAAIEAMSAGCQVVTSSLGALPETTGGFATMYGYVENKQFHANMFAGALKQAVDNHESFINTNKANVQKNWTDYVYNWDIRVQEWENLLRQL
jgi:glycosyltransferase involved in cell wall biosynthesis